MIVGEGMLLSRRNRRTVGSAASAVGPPSWLGVEVDAEDAEPLAPVGLVDLFEEGQVLGGGEASGRPEDDEYDVLLGVGKSDGAAVHVFPLDGRPKSVANPASGRVRGYP